MREIEHQLFPWVALGVVPAFAFFNSGIALSRSTADALLSLVSLGIVLGLFVGKPLGVFGATWLAVKLGLAKLPETASWRQICGVALLVGIGFTMSLFIAGLALADPTVFHNARLSIIVGSLLSATAGIVVLWSARGSRPAARKGVEPFP